MTQRRGRHFVNNCRPLDYSIYSLSTAEQVASSEANQRIALVSIELVKVVVKVYILSMGRHSQCLEKTKTEVYTSLVARKPHHIKLLGS